MKCILNILSLIPDCIKIPLSIFEIEDYDSIYKSLEKHNNLFDEINALRHSILITKLALEEVMKKMK